jgi:hypothetical protein
MKAVTSVKVAAADATRHGRSERTRVVAAVATADRPQAVAGVSESVRSCRNRPLIVGGVKRSLGALGIGLALIPNCVEIGDCS